MFSNSHSTMGFRWSNLANTLEIAKTLPTYFSAKSRTTLFLYFTWPEMLVPWVFMRYHGSRTTTIPRFLDTTHVNSRSSKSFVNFILSSFHGTNIPGTVSEQSSYIFWYRRSNTLTCIWHYLTETANQNLRQTYYQPGKLNIFTRDTISPISNHRI